MSRMETKHSIRRSRRRFTGRVTLVKQEPDGDLHIKLVDEDGEDGPVNLVVEVPLGEPWCEIRKEVLSWTNRKIPFSTNGKKLGLSKKPVIRVTRKAFFDAIHGGGDTTKNRRPVPKNASATFKERHDLGNSSGHEARSNPSIGAAFAALVWR